MGLESWKEAVVLRKAGPVKVGQVQSRGCTVTLPGKSSSHLWTHH